MYTKGKPGEMETSITLCTVGDLFLRAKNFVKRAKALFVEIIYFRGLTFSVHTSTYKYEVS